VAKRCREDVQAQTPVSNLIAKEEEEEEEVCSLDLSEVRQEPEVSTPGSVLFK